MSVSGDERECALYRGVAVPSSTSTSLLWVFSEPYGNQRITIEPEALFFIAALCTSMALSVSPMRASARTLTSELIVLALLALVGRGGCSGRMMSSCAQVWGVKQSH